MSYLKEYKKDVAWLKRNGSTAGNRIQSATINLAHHISECGDWSNIVELDKIVSACSGVRSKGWRTYVLALVTGINHTDEKGWVRKQKVKVGIVEGLLDVNFRDHNDETVQKRDMSKIMNLTPAEVWSKYVETEGRKYEKALENGFKGDSVAALQRLQDA